MFYGILKSRIVHVHISKPFYLLIMTLICKCFNVSVIITIHSNIDRFLYLEKSLLNLAIYLVDYPIVLNENSFQHAMCFNDNTILMSAFIPKTELKAVENRWIKTLRNIISHANLQSHCRLCSSTSRNFLCARRKVLLLKLHHIRVSEPSDFY